MKRTSFPYKEEFHLISSKGSEYLRYLMRQQTELLMLCLGPFLQFFVLFFSSRKVEGARGRYNLSHVL